MALNTAVVMGRLVYEPELKASESGMSFTRFCVACDRSYQKGDEKQTDFIDCIAFAQTAEFINRNFHKGQMIALEGNIQTKSFVDKDGNNRKTVNVVADYVTFCGDKNRTQPTSEDDIDIID